MSNKAKDENKRLESKEKKQSSVRSILFMGVTILLIVGIPLLTVWKQVYITNNSLKREMLSDSLEVLNTQVAQLQVSVADLSRVERIEKIAIEELGLIYPESDNIEVVQAQRKKMPSLEIKEWKLFTMLKKSLSKEEI